MQANRKSRIIRLGEADDVAETAEIVKIAKASTRIRTSLAHKRDRTAITSAAARTDPP